MPALTNPPAPNKRSPAKNKESREERQHRIQAELIQQGMQLFSEQGFEQTTIPAIAEAVGISRRTFFRYFDAKEDLVFHWLDEMGEIATDVLQQCSPQELPGYSMQKGYMAIARFLEEQGEGLLMRTQLIFREPSLRRRYWEENNKWEERFATTINNRLAAQGIDRLTLQVNIATVTTAFVVGIRHWSMSDDTQPLTYWVEQAFNALVIPDKP